MVIFWKTKLNTVKANSKATDLDSPPPAEWPHAHRRELSLPTAYCLNSMAEPLADPPPPPVPPDLLFLFGSSDPPPHRESPSIVSDSGLSSPSPILSSPQVPQNPVLSAGQPTQTPWAALFKPVSQNLVKIASPSFDEDGTPTVKAPDSITLGSSQVWKNHLAAYFHGTPPSPAKIFSDLNPIWGIKGRISVKKQSSRVCFIHIPCEETRKWVLDVGFWYSGNCSFTVVPWSASAKLAPMKLVHAPVWVLFKNIPPELWSFVGFSTIAFGVGLPVHSEFPKITPYSNGITKLKIVIDLYKERSPFVRVTDRLGASVLVEAFYPKLPPRCSRCKEFGHLQLRCPEPFSPPVNGPPSPVKPVNLTSPTPSVNPRSHRQSSSPSPAPQGRSTSLPSSPSVSRAASNSFDSVTFVRRDPILPVLDLKGATLSPPKPVTTAQFEEEEELIKTAQEVLRARPVVVDDHDPPYQLVVSKKERKKQRQKLLSLSLSNSQPEEGSSRPAASVHSRLVFGTLDQAALGPAPTALT
ncbi:unnamed protein product [Microthlaspi erraticum]|uniref:DUF4283 domain-containing protein n=1 Tax=Microthlaspi erraticum TaxID=1685480 RepID=A0A6D2KTC8_9BRAS|nr:unnamed protein product [Microthlaspi erraticum]